MDIKMATKAENIIRLKALAVILGREVNETGTAADIEQRVKEWEEEAAELQEPDEGTGTGQDDDGDVVVALSQPGGMVLVRFLKTVHLHGATDESGKPVSIPVAGSLGRLPAGDAETLKGAGLLVILSE